MYVEKDFFLYSLGSMLQMILNIFAKKCGENVGIFLLKITYSEAVIIIKKTAIFSPKMSKNREKSDHNNDP
jgi:hypothetical protein